MSKDIWVIGVAAACPRCDLLAQRVEKLAKALLPSAFVKKMLNTDAQAIEYAAVRGKKIKTVKEIALLSRIKIDWKHFATVANNPPTPPEDIDSLEGPARQWSPELDETLRPYQEYAESTGMLLTPVLVVGGDVKNHGSVPSIDQLRAWLCCPAHKVEHISENERIMRK